MLRLEALEDRITPYINRGVPMLAYPDVKIPAVLHVEPLPPKHFHQMGDVHVQPMTNEIFRYPIVAQLIADLQATPIKPVVHIRIDCVSIFLARHHE
jgi:hypothetical protein